MSAFIPNFDKIRLHAKQIFKKNKIFKEDATTSPCRVRRIDLGLFLKNYYQKFLVA